MTNCWAGYKKPEDIVGENGLLKQLTKALLERAMQAEMTDHLGMEWWQRLAIYVAPPLIIAILIIWRAVYKATTHPDQKLLKKVTRKRHN